MMREGLLVIIALLYSAAEAALGRRLTRPASSAAYVTALATLGMVVLLSEATVRRVDDLLGVVGSGRLLFYLALMTRLSGLFLTIMLATHQWAPRHWWALGGAAALTLGYVGLWLRVQALDLATAPGVFAGPRVGSPPTVLWLHIVTGGGVVYLTAWGLPAFLAFLRGARSTYEQGVAGAVVLLYLLLGLSGVCTVVEAVGQARGRDMTVLYRAKPGLRLGLASGATGILLVQIWLWPLWRQRREILLRYLEPEWVQLRQDLLNLSAAEAEVHLEIHPTAYANRAIVEEIAARCRMAGIPPARSAMARMAACLLTLHRDHLLQDPGYGLVTSWEALQEEAAAALDQTLARTAWERALRDSWVSQQVYILLFLVLDDRAYRERLLVNAQPPIQAWHQRLADLIATVMQQHGHTTPRARVFAQQAAQRPSLLQRGARWLNRRQGAEAGRAEAGSTTPRRPAAYEPPLGPPT